MVRLTPELIEDSYQYVNPIREYELNLRGLPLAFFLLSSKFPIFYLYFVLQTFQIK